MKPYFLFLTFLVNALVGTYAQGTLIIVRAILNSPLPGYHVDEFDFMVTGQVKTLTASMNFGPLNQISAGGSLSVFPPQLSPAEVPLDSHLTFDISHARVISSYEDNFTVTATVEFASDYPTGQIPLGHAVASNDHSPYSARVLGTFVDGTPFFASIVFVPEPEVLTVSATGFAIFFARRRFHRPNRA